MITEQLLHLVLTHFTGGILFERASGEVLGIQVTLANS